MPSYSIDAKIRTKKSALVFNNTVSPINVKMRSWEKTVPRNTSRWRTTRLVRSMTTNDAFSLCPSYGLQIVPVHVSFVSRILIILFYFCRLSTPIVLTRRTNHSLNDRLEKLQPLGFQTFGLYRWKKWSHESKRGKRGRREVVPPWAKMMCHRRRRIFWMITDTG